MTFPEAIASCCRKYADATGRAPRSEYWYFRLLYVVVLAAAVALTAAVDSLTPGAMVLATLVLPDITVTVRRLHDTGKSGWFVLAGMIPFIGPLLLLAWMISSSDPDNAYGPCPIDREAIRERFEERFVVDDRPPGYDGPILDERGDVVEPETY